MSELFSKILQNYWAEKSSVSFPDKRLVDIFFNYNF